VDRVVIGQVRHGGEGRVKPSHALADLRNRAARIKLVVTDNDGVLTDSGVYYSERGEELKRFSVRDGMGVERLRNAGIGTAILTRELSGCVKARAAKLRLPFTWLGVIDKEAHLETILEETGVKAHELAFIGDDVNDLGLMTKVGQVGLTAAPGDAMTPALEVAIFVTRSIGGHGAFREFAEWILSLRGEAS
jgi:3-deoxy-D-manno-octulosonate 8-phosphate phosphatase (KDO 8-P phosphatase)